MARTALAITDVTAQPPNVQVGAVAMDAVNNNMFLNDGRIVLIVGNPSGGSLNVTFVSVADRLGRTGDLVISIPAGLQRIVGPLPQTGWNQLGTDVGNVYINPGSGLNVALFRLAAYGSTP
jgi:hypothetical protein